MGGNWHKASEEHPKTNRKEVKLLAWFEVNGTSYDYGIIKYRTSDGQFCNLRGHPLMIEKLWWKYLSKPKID